MIAERIQQQQQQDTEFSTNNTKYYQLSTILEHVIDCFHTIVSDETNPYHPPLSWLTRKQPKPPDDELFLDLMDECNKHRTSPNSASKANETIQLSSSVRTRLERCPQQLRREIVSRTQDGCPPLFMACRNGLIRVIKYLLDVCEADIEQKGLFEAFEDHHVHNVSPIWVAAVSGQLEVVKLLIDRGSNVNSVSDTGSTPIRSVCFLCKDDDGTQDELDDFNNETLPFGECSESEDSPDIYMKIVHLLVDNGADISKANNSGVTCLINSLHSYHLTAYMISHGADVNSVDNQHKTALHYAIQQNRLAVAKLLLESGSDPYLTTKTGDDPLQLCCIGGYVNIFEHLIENYTYSQETLANAYKLLGSSILEIHYDLALVREYWTKSLELSAEAAAETAYNNQNERTKACCSTADTTAIIIKKSTKLTSPHGAAQVITINQQGDHDNSSRRGICDIRRKIAYGDATEFTSLSELNHMSMDDFRIQSLLISERVLGQTHRETIQRLLYRGTFYINSLRPNRCLDLWIYALRLRLETDSIHHVESVLAAQAITKFFLDLFSQRQQQQVRFNDVYDVLSMLVCRLGDCQQNKDIFDLVLTMIVKLLLVLRCSQRKDGDARLSSAITRELVELDPRTSKGSSLLHLCVAPNMFEGEIHRSLLIASEGMAANRGNNIMESNDGGNCQSSPIIELLDNLISAGLSVDSINNDRLSALQTICLAPGIGATDKKQIIDLLVRNGAHVDRRALTLEQDDHIKQALQESGVKLIDFVTLKCLAARKLSEARTFKRLDESDKMKLSRDLRELVAIH